MLQITGGHGRRHRSELREACVYLGGGVRLNKEQLRAMAKSLGIYLQTGLQYPGAAKPRSPSKDLPKRLQSNRLTTACIRRVRSWGATTLGDATRPSSTSRAPQTLPELANMLRDPEGRLPCPIGIDWENQSGGCSRLDRLHRIPFWLALIEMHGDGHRYGVRSDRNLLFVFDELIECLRLRRMTRQQASQGASGHGRPRGTAPK